MPKQLQAVAVADSWVTFIHLVMSGITPAIAAEQAGYADPKRTAIALMQSPPVRKALADAAKIQIECELVPLALKVSREILEDTNPKAVAVRAKLAMALIDRAAKNEARAPDPGKPLQDMTTAELERLVSAGRAAEAQEARTIDVTPRKGRNESDPLA